MNHLKKKLKKNLLGKFDVSSMTRWYQNAVYHCGSQFYLYDTFNNMLLNSFRPELAGQNVMFKAYY